MKCVAISAFLSAVAHSGNALDTGMGLRRNVSLRAANTSRDLPHAAAQLHTVRANSTVARANTSRVMPCQCHGSDATWTRCVRTIPKCVFIDLGAADGNSFNQFLNNGYGAISNCPSGGQWEAILVEANPRFKPQLDQEAARFPGAVQAHAATAAYMCEGQTSFYLDTVTHGQNYWGSSMADNHPDVVKSGKTKVTVPTINLNRILAEQTIPGDYVMVKMDIEGAEFDIIPCLAYAPVASLMDALWMEQHDPSWGLAGTTLQVMEQAKAQLQANGVYMPTYFSPTLLARGSKVHTAAHKVF